MNLNDLFEGTGLSPDTLASYKKKAGAEATAADKAGDFKKGNKRFSGIVQATKKQFANDEKGIKEGVDNLNDDDWYEISADTKSIVGTINQRPQGAVMGRPVKLPNGNYAIKGMQAKHMGLSQGVAEGSSEKAPGYRYLKQPWVSVIVRTKSDYDPALLRQLPLEYKAQGWGNDGVGQLIAFASKKDAAYFILKQGGKVVKTFANSLNDRLGNQGVAEGVADTIKKVGNALVKPVKDPILNQMKDIGNAAHKREIDAQNKKYAPAKMKEQGVSEAFDSAAFDRHMDKLRAQKELEKTDPMRALVNKMHSDDAHAAKMKQRDPSTDDTNTNIHSPFHPSQGVNVAEGSGLNANESWAQKVFDDNPNIETEDEILNHAYAVIKAEVGNKTARYLLNYDEDFPSDLVSSYRWMQKNKQGVAEGATDQYKAAFQAIQKLQSFAQDNPDFNLSQLDNLPSRGNLVKPMFVNADRAIDSIIQAYITRKEPGNAEFLKQLKNEIKYFLTDRTASSDPTTLGDLLQGKLGKVNFQQGVAEGDLKMLPRQGNETNDERQERLKRKLDHEFKTKTGQFANYNDNPYPSLNQYNAHGDDEYQAKKLKKQQGVAEGQSELDAIKRFLAK